MKLSDYTTARVGLGSRAIVCRPKRCLIFVWRTRAPGTQCIFLSDVVGLPTNCGTQVHVDRRCTVRPGIAKNIYGRPDLGDDWMPIRKGIQKSSLSNGSHHCRWLFGAGCSPPCRSAHWRMCLETTSPILLAQQGRVAIGDHIGELVKADLSIVIIGERRA